MEYSQILGQESSVKYLKKSLINNKQNHALIFEGEDGMGKMALAMVYAKSLFCTSQNRPCGECSGCKKFEHGNHTDFKLVEPKSKKSISTEDITEMLSDAHLVPNEMGSKVYIVEKAHMMTTAAQNKLLKTLEEPPEYLTIIMLCDNISNILPTIISRAVTIKMKKLPDEAIQSELIKKGADKKKAGDISALANGNLGYALKVLEDKAALNKYEEYKNVFFGLQDGKIDAFSYFDKKRSDAESILSCWQKVLSDCLKFKTGSKKKGLSENEIKFTNNHSIDDIIDKLTYVLQAETRLSGNAQYLPTVDWLLSNL